MFDYLFITFSDWSCGNESAESSSQKPREAIATELSKILVELRVYSEVA
jgi:hypothetical protein